MNFRGGNAPASLKQDVVDATRYYLAKFPGWKRPGLIEAEMTRTEDPKPYRISGVETPRPH